MELSNASAVKQKSRFVPQDLLSRETYELTGADSEAFSTAWNRQWGALVPKMVAFQFYNGMTVAGANMFHRLRQLSSVRSQVRSIRDLDANTLYCFTNNVLLLERHINIIVNWPSPMPRQCPLYASSLAFIYTVFRDVPTTSSILDNFVVRLKRALGDVGVENFCRQFSPESLLWLLFVGSWIAQGRPDRQWYYSTLSWLTDRLGFRRWEQVKAVLVGYCFVESVCEEPYRKLLEESRHWRS